MTKTKNIHFEESGLFENLTNQSDTTRSNKIDYSIYVNLDLTRVEVALLVTLFTLTILGNSIVILIILFCPNRKNLSNRSRSCLALNKHVSRMSFYILNLSIADFNVALMSILPQIMWRNSIVFNSSQVLCKLVTFSQVFSVYVSTFLLLVMAYDRYTSVCKPIERVSWSCRKAILEILIGWSLAALVSAPQVFLFKIQPLRVEKARVIETCSIVWSSKYAEGSYIMFHFATQFLIPLLILIVLYANIFLTVSKNIREKNISLKFENENPSSTKTRATLLIDERPGRNSTTETNRSKSFKFFQPMRKYFQIDRKQRKNSKKPKVVYSNKNLSKNVLIRISSSMQSLNDNNKTNNSVNLKSLKNNPPMLRQNFSGKELNKAKIKTLKLTLTVVLAYIVCSLPFYVSTLANFYFDISSKIKVSNSITQTLIYLTILTNLLYQLNSCANPFIFILFNGYARKTLTKRWHNFYGHGGKSNRNTRTPVSAFK